MSTDQHPAIRVSHLTKHYRLYQGGRDRLLDFLWPQRKRSVSVPALTDLSFAIPPGEVVGIIGPNGSGKSTLLELISGVLRPTSGTIATTGRITALLALGAGFSPDFTGRENVLLNATLLGLDSDEIQQHLPDILAFAEIGDFVDRPVRTYSSGMYVRLAFAVAANVDPDILIVDEALAVGDAYFQQKCIRRMRDFRAQGKTILFVSHDMALVKALCDRAILLQQGQLIDDGRPATVVAHYFGVVQGFSPQPPATPITPPVTASGSAAPTVERTVPRGDLRYGTGTAHILGLACYDEQGAAVAQLTTGDPLRLRISVVFHSAVAKPIVGFILRDRLGKDLAGANTAIDGLPLPPAAPGTIYTVRFAMALPRLHPANYTISPSVADGDLDHYEVCDAIDHALAIEIGGTYQTGCIMHPAVEIELEPITSP